MAREPKHRTGQRGIIAALDVGSSKITCFLARIEQGRGGAAPYFRILGIGHQVSEGIRSGAVIDMVAAENAIRAAVDAAERMAEVKIDEAVVAFTTGSPSSERITASIPLGGNEIGDHEVRRVLQLGCLKAEQTDRDAVHVIPVTYSIDGSTGIKEPRGMYGESLGVMMNVVTAAAAPFRNLQVCVERCHLRIADQVVAPYASALAALVEDEMDLGATCVDMGAGTTSLAVFRFGHLVHCDILPVGGMHVTKDIATGLSTTLAHAERMKTLHGSVLAGPADEREMLSVPLIGEEESDEPLRVPRASLTNIIRPRLEETFELLRERLSVAGAEAIGGRRVVLTGGASQMNGVRELAQRILDRPVRLALPPPLQGMPPATSGPAFSAAVGVLKFATERPDAGLKRRIETERHGRGQMARIGQWIREKF
jgi:cell division protein FtsA